MQYKVQISDPWELCDEVGNDGVVICNFDLFTDDSEMKLIPASEINLLKGKVVFAVVSPRYEGDVLNEQIAGRCTIGGTLYMEKSEQNFIGTIESFT